MDFTPQTPDIFPADGILLTAWRGGDMRAAKRLYRRHFDAICRFFRNKLSDLPEVADLVGETFLELVKTRARQADDESWSDDTIVSLRGYLLGIARNVLFRHFKAKYRGRHIDFDRCSLADLDARNLSSIVGGRRELDILIRALRRLPVEDQILLEAKYFDYLSEQQLAELLQIPLSTLPGRLRGARNRLLAEVARLCAERPGSGPDDPATAMDAWIAELRALIAQTNPSPPDDDDPTS